MKVKAGSWHYWVWCLGRGTDYMGRRNSQPKNLCKYFWHIVLKVVLALTVVGLALTGIGAILYLVLSFPVVFGMGVIGLAIICLIVIGLGYLVGIWVDHRVNTKEAREERKQARWHADMARKRARENQPPGTLGLTWAFIKAKKAKYCPLIEVVDK